MSNLLRWFVDLAKEIDRGMSVMRGGKPEVSGGPEVLIGESGVLVRMAGVPPEDVDLMISDTGALTISGIIRPEDTADEKAYNLEDLGAVETFREVVNLPVGYESGEAKAILKSGVLEVSVEKSEAEAEARQLRIEKN